MPFKTRYGSHYHMTEGCHGATIPCGTEGLTPCSDCCGGGAGGKDVAGGGIGAGSPVTGGMPHDEWKAYQDADAELDAMIEAASSPDYDFDEMADDAFPFGDGGKYSLYGSSDYFPDEDNQDAFYQAEASDSISEAGRQGLQDGMTSPSDMGTDDVAKALTNAQSEGMPYDAWDEGTRTAAAKAGIPDTARSLGAFEGTYVFETTSVSTRNPNDSSNHYGEWLYDVHDVKVIMEDGTDLTPTIHVVRNLRQSMRHDSQRFSEQCEAEARRRVQEPIIARRTEAVDEAREQARKRYEAEVVTPWQAGYDTWRKEHDQQAKDIEEAMRHDRPEWRHQYIPGDVEDRMRRQYERRHPRPARWSYALPEYQEATEQGIAEADRQMRAEGYDVDAEVRRLTAEVRRERDPEGRQGVSKAMRTNYDDAMDRLRKHPLAADLALADIPLTWGNTMGMPVGMPEAWKRRIQKP